MNGGSTACGFAKFGYNLTVVFPLHFEIDSSEEPLDEERFKTYFSMTLKSDKNCQTVDASCALPLNLTKIEFLSHDEGSGTTSFDITVRSIINTGSHLFFNSGTPRFILYRFECKLSLPNNEIGVCGVHRPYFLLCVPLPMIILFSLGHSTFTMRSVAYLAL